VACITFQPTLLKVSAHTQWVAQALHNPCPAAYPADTGSSHFQNAIFKMTKSSHITPHCSPEKRACCLTSFWHQSASSWISSAVTLSWLRLIVPVQVSHSERMGRVEGRGQMAIFPYFNVCSERSRRIH
jgi:hypothetical protein